MNSVDFQDFPNISQYEIQSTGAKIEDVQYELINKIQKLRNMINLPVNFIKNGITTGNHKSPGHPKGLAADIHFGSYEDFYNVYRLAIDLGFNKIGIYYNGHMYSYHLEMYSDKPAFWIGTKKPAMKHWKYTSFRELIDPKNI